MDVAVHTLSSFPEINNRCDFVIGLFCGMLMTYLGPLVVELELLGTSLVSLLECNGCYMLIRLYPIEERQADRQAWISSLRSEEGDTMVAT